MGYRRQSPQPVIEGGTGKQTLTAYAVLCGGTGAGAVNTPIQSIAGVGTAGQVLTSNGAGALPTFQPVSGGTAVSTLTGNTGGPISPTAGNINVVGTGSITIAGNAGTSTLTVTPGATIPTSFVTDSGTAIPSANIINIIANPTAQTCGKTVRFTGSGNTVQLNVSDVGGNTLVGFGAGGAVLTGIQNTGFGYGAANSVSSGEKNTAVGYLAANTLTSGSSNTIIGESAAQNLTTSSNNTVIGANAASNITSGANNIVIGQNAGDSLTTNSTNTLIGNVGIAGTTQFFAIDAGSGGTTFMQNYPGVSGITSTTGGNLFFGRDAGNFTLTGAIRAGNNGFGESTLNTITSGFQNNAMGCFTLGLVTTGTSNTSIGHASGSQLTTGTSNTLIGLNAGTNYTGAESSNICINSSGNIAESNTLRIGAGQGTGARQLNRAFIHGIRGITPSAGNAIPVVIDSNGQLGTEGAGGSGPAFFAYLNTTQTFNSSVLTKVNFDTILLNRDSGYNSGTATFTAPETGTYSFSIGITYNFGSGATKQGFVRLTTSNGNVLMNFSNYTNIMLTANVFAAFPQNTRLFIGNTAYMSLTTGDTVKVELINENGGASTNISGFDVTNYVCTYFGGQLV